MNASTHAVYALLFRRFTCRPAAFLLEQRDLRVPRRLLAAGPLPANSARRRRIAIGGTRRIAPKGQEKVAWAIHFRREMVKWGQ